MDERFSPFQLHDYKGYDNLHKLQLVLLVLEFKFPVRCKKVCTNSYVLKK